MTSRSKPISSKLLKIKDEIKEFAINYGLDFYPVRFEVCDYDTINILAALGGFPMRYPHWRHGMTFEQLSKGYTYGIQKIYEMVVNTDPCYAYLLKANSIVDQKIVMAHVYGHADFFKNNYWFHTSDRKMMDVMANHGTKIRRYMALYGVDKVEHFIDKVLSLENLVDFNDLFETTDLQRRRKFLENEKKKEDKGQGKDGRSDALKSFMSDTVRSKKKKQDKDDEGKPKKEEEEKKEKMAKFPAKPQRDVMLFLAQNAPLTEWQADIIGILREEAYYFLPQRVTKIMNEGWASYWHSTIMTQDIADASEIIDFADHHAGVMQMSKQNINPYKLGLELLRDIEFRFNTGRFGKEYNECDDMSVKANWDMKLGKGREKIFEIRKTHNDITFIDEFLTPEFCDRAQMFTYKYNIRTGRFEIDSRDFEAIKSKLLSSLTNFGSPIIEIEDANFRNRGELLLKHQYFGVDLDMNYAHDTMKNIHYIWKRPINLATIFDDKEVVFVYDGQDFKPVGNENPA